MEDDTKLFSFWIKKSLHRRLKIFLVSKEDPETFKSFINDAIEAALDKCETESRQQ